MPLKIAQPSPVRPTPALQGSSILNGRIAATTPIFSQAAITGTIPLRTTRTFYSTYGDVFAWACVIMARLLTLVAKRRIYKLKV